MSGPDHHPYITIMCPRTRDLLGSQQAHHVGRKLQLQLRDGKSSKMSKLKKKMYGENDLKVMLSIFLKISLPNFQPQNKLVLLISTLKLG